MDRLEAMRVFCTVVEAGSFITAADRLGLSATAVSRQVAHLEKHLNARLIHRTTRRMKLTDIGFLYFERCVQLLHDLEEAEADVSAQATRPHGRLRLTAPLDLSTHCLAPPFAAFAARYPEVSLDVLLSDERIDFAEEGLDMAIRAGFLGSDTLVARRIGEFSLLPAASPSYLEAYGSPKKLEDIESKPFLGYTHSSSGQVISLINPQHQTVSIRCTTTIQSNNGAFLAELAAAGAGITFGPCFILQPFIESGRLVRLLPEFSPVKQAIHVVYPTRKNLSAKVQAMTQFLITWFAEHPLSTS